MNPALAAAGGVSRLTAPFSIHQTPPGAKIRRMAVFTFSEETIARIAPRTQRVRMWFRAVAVAWLVLDVSVAVGQLYWPAIRTDLSAMWVNFAFIIPIILLFNNFQLRKHMLERMEAYMRSYSIDVSPYSVRVQSDLGPQRQFARDEILRVEESSWGGGLYLRSSNRYRWLVIPRGLDGYSQMKDELRASGIPFVEKVIPTNWEEFAIVFLYCGTLICDLVTRNRQVLTANLIVAILVGIVMFLIIGANPDSPRRMRWVRFAAFLPAAFTVLWFFL
jgi:hypothetical protein